MENCNVSWYHQNEVHLPWQFDTFTECIMVMCVCVCANEGGFLEFLHYLPTLHKYIYIYKYLLTCLLCLVCQLSSPQKKGYIFHNNYYRYHHRTTTAKFGSPSFRPGLCFKDFGRDAITQKSTQTVNLGPSLRTHLRKIFLVSESVFR